MAESSKTGLTNGHHNYELSSKLRFIRKVLLQDDRLKTMSVPSFFYSTLLRLFERKMKLGG
ncbi:CFC_HP_G0057270.mRNA.1.CDS.1 [Saccharomyces cerevisiae]|nr:CFC_HP_G0057270.mRNA.1.CDS.1 [Saccharomyces cerevisiae]CAI6541086.1 CFC_HP_G0057270.mRNA.1.CDS.1 [Saccharomyces cerevisiae]